METIFQKVYLTSVGICLPDEVMTTLEIDAALAQVYQRFDLPQDTIQLKTGIEARRLWPRQHGIVPGSMRAARDALDRCGLCAQDLDVIIYAGVSRDAIEPSTAAILAQELGAKPTSLAYDTSNACLGMLNGIMDLANRIELGQATHGIVIGCESAREIIEETLAYLSHENYDLAEFTTLIPTMTGGSGAAAIVISREARATSRRIRGLAAKSAYEYSGLCRWEYVADTPSRPRGYRQRLVTHGSKNLKAGINLAVETWTKYLEVMGWNLNEIDKIITHQVGRSNQNLLMQGIGIDAKQNYPTFPELGNVGAAALPLTFALAERDGFLGDHHNVSLLGIGSGLNCMMIGLDKIHGDNSAW